MPLTPVPGFSTLTFTPQWEVSYSVEFKNKERPLGNGYTQITDGGTANPEEIVNIDIIRTSTAIDSVIADLRSFQGSTPFNWRLYPGGNYKLYYCTDFTGSMQSLTYDAFTATFTRHPDPQYDPQPAVVADGVPWGILTQPIAWEKLPQTYEATPNSFGYRDGEVAPRKAKSIFAAQNTKGMYRVVFPYLSQARFEAIDLFLRQRRGRIPFQFSHDANNVSARLWICSRYNVTLLGRDTSDTVNRWRMELELREVYRAAPVNAIAITPTVNISPASATIPEGSSTAYTVTLSNASLSSVTVPFAMSGTATNVTDYTVTPSPLIISAGQTTGTITLNALTDAAAEGNETAIVTLGAPTNATLGTNTTATTTITNVTGAQPSVSISPTTATIAEGNATTYTVTLSSTSASTVTIPFTMSGTATNGTDYTVTASPLTIAAGQTTTTITVTTLNDAVVDANETAIITLGTPTNATLGSPTVATTTISDEDAIVTAWVTATVAAGGAVATATRTAMDIFVKGLKADGVWTILSSGLIIPFASDAFVGCLTPLIAPSGYVATTSAWSGATYTLTTGLDARNSSGQVSTNINPSGFGLSQTSAQISAYERINSSGGSILAYSNNDLNTQSMGLLPSDSGTSYWDAFNVTASGRVLATAATRFISGRRIGTTISLLQNATSVATGNNATGTLPTNNFQILGHQGLAGYFGVIAYLAIHPALSDTQETQYYNRVQALQTALGRQV